MASDDVRDIKTHPNPPPEATSGGGFLFCAKKEKKRNGAEPYEWATKQI
jgi:hypothetical protein